MTHFRTSLILPWLLTATATAAAPSPAVAPAPELTLGAAEGFIVMATVNGVAMRLRVDPGAVGIILNPEPAARARLRGSFLSRAIDPKATIGPVRVPFQTGGTSVSIGAWRGTREYYVFAKDFAPGADGVIGMGDLPSQIVTLRLGPSRPGETAYRFPVREQVGAGLYFRHPVADRQIQARFSLLAPASYASAAAGALLAEHHSGTWAGEASSIPIALDVSRPVRPMRFARPVSLIGFQLDRLLIRTSDYKGSYVLPSDQSADPDEIIVTGSRSKSPAAFRMTVGADRLASCSSLTYRKHLRELTLNCLQR